MGLLRRMGMANPEDMTLFILTGQLEARIRIHPGTGKKEVPRIPDELAGVMFIAHRCLYAEITSARLDGHSVDLDRAYARAISMFVSRTWAVAEGWRKWVEDGELTGGETRLIAEKYRNRIIVTYDVCGQYTLHQALLAEHEETKSRDKTRARRDRARPPPARQAPARAPTGGRQMPLSVAPHAAEAVAEMEVEEPSADRDMAGDALTTAQAMERGVPAQCTLATVRNVRRNPQYTRERLAENVVHSAYAGDILMPDWPKILDAICTDDEAVYRGHWGNIPQSHMMYIRAAVSINSGPSTAHVVAVIRNNGAFNIYDNDSPERQRGTFLTATTDDMANSRGGHLFYAVIPSSTPLAGLLGDSLTTLVRTRPARERQEGPLEAMLRRTRARQE